MSSTFSNASPFATALPAAHTFFAYDADGDAIMTDAATGLPITYGGAGTRRPRSASLDSDSADSRPSKRSRTSSDDDDGEGGASSSSMPPLIPVCPPAPKKTVRVLNPEDDDDDDNDGDGGALRNLAEQMAEAVLAGEPLPWPGAAQEPREDAAVPPAEPAPVPIVPGGDGPAEVGPEGEREYCVSVTVHDLALRLDMRHPRVVLNFLRFVNTYNELAPAGEEIHLPPMNAVAAESILDHVSITNPAPEFAAEVAELRALVAEFALPDQQDNGDEDEDRYSTDSEDSHRYYGYD